MSNSKLVNYTRLSPNNSGKRGHKIDKITIHHMAGNLTVETCGQVFADPSRQASATYGIGTDGRVGQYLDESMHPWTTSNWDNDDRAITIEVANSKVGGDWPVSKKAYEKLIELCFDICKRNGIKRLKYTGNKSGNLTMHKWFAATACPGPYLSARFKDIADRVNKKLAALEPTHSAKLRSYSVYNKPTLKGKVIKTMKKGDTIYCFGYKRVDGMEWWKISNSGEQYIRKDILYPIKALKGKAATHSAKIRGYVVYNKPSMKADGVNVLQPGAEVKCYGYKKAEGIEWWKISPTAEQYVRKDALYPIKKL